MKDLASLMKQATSMQSRLREAQAKIAEAETEGVAGGGLVKVTLKGSGDLIKLEIDPSLLNPGDGEIVADLIIAAHNDAKRRVDAAQAEMMRDVAGPLANLPGMPKLG
jgi:hypothetical protein